jgi:multidrug resistance efflux pump
MKIRFDTPPVSAQQSNGLAVRYAAAKREVPRWRWYLMLAVIGLPLAYFVWRFVVATWWETAPGFVIVPTLTVKASGAGTVRDIVAAGAVVEPGAPLLRVVPVPVVTAGAVRPAASPVAAVPPGRDASLALLDRATALAQRTLAFRRERLAAIEALKRDGAATQAEVEALRARAVQAEAEVIRAQADAQARRDALALQVRAAAVDTARADPAPPAPATVVVASPFVGTVTAVLVAAGEYVTPSTDVLLLQGKGAPTIEAYVSPSDARYARVGRRASLRFFDGAVASAVVTGVSGQTARVPSERVGPLSPRTQAILVHLRPEQELPARYRINVLPLDVRFETVWPWSDPAR